MTTKELCYLQDALGHEQYFQNGELKACVQEMAKKHQQLFDKFYSLL